jgi:hypothetical protein
MLHHLNPTLPLYRVMAPEFRFYWDLCIERFQEKQEQQVIQFVVCVEIVF